METSTTFPGYFYYTLSALIIPFLVNFLFILKQLLSKDKNTNLIEIGFSRRKCLPKMSPIAYQIIYGFWILSLLLFYPLISKLLYIVNVYHALKAKKSLTLAVKTTKVRDDEMSEIIEDYQIQCKHISSEVVRSEIVLAVTALTFQPLIQSFSLRNALESCYSNDMYDAMEVISYPQFRSILACSIGFSAILTTHSVYVKHSANTLSKLPIKHLSARLLLFTSYLLQMVGRLMILVYSSANIFQSYDHLELIIVLHVIVMSTIHIVDYFCVKKLSPNLLCISFWVELLLNGCASVFVPMDLSCGKEVWRNKKDGRPANRYYVSSTARYLMMYSVIICESAVLLGFSYTDEESAIPFIVSLVSMLIGILLYTFYYCFVYPWPLEITESTLTGIFCSKEINSIKNYPSLLDNDGQEVLSNYKVGGLEMEVVTPKTQRTPKTPRSRSRIAFNIPDEETEM